MYVSNHIFASFFLYKTVSIRKREHLETKKVKEEKEYLPTSNKVRSLDFNISAIWACSFALIEQFNLVLPYVCDSKLSQSVMKNNCKLRKESISSLFDFLDLFLIEVAFSCFQQCSFNELIIP